MIEKITDAMIDGAALGDKDCQWRVCKAMQGAIKKLATSFCQQRPDLDLDDLIQEGYLCVLRCVDGYIKKDRKAKFSTYAFRAILNTFILHSDRTWRTRLGSFGWEMIPDSETAEHEWSQEKVTPSDNGSSASSRSEDALDEMKEAGFTDTEIHVMMARDGGRTKSVLTFEEIGKMLGISRKLAQESYESAIMKTEAIRSKESK